MNITASLSLADDDVVLEKYSPSGQHVVSDNKSVIFDEILRRDLDLFIALGAIIFLTPLLCCVGLAVLLQDGGPVFYGQDRIGRGGRRFTCWKFRSMVVDAGDRLRAVIAMDPAARSEWDRDHKLRKDPRITWIGRFLRRSSLDELPQLFNVLIGEMSIVGPRPIIAAEAFRYGARFKHYCQVKPGITGLWQVNGRNDTTYKQRVALDTLYVQRQSMLLNIKIIMATVPAVLFSRGSY